MWPTGGRTVKTVSIQGPEDARSLPAYSLGEAARYLRLPLPTLRAWVVGRNYSTKTGRHRSPPALSLAGAKPPMLSFVNLLEAHVLAAITRDYDVPLQQVRRALTFLGKQFESKHPLIDRIFETNRRDLFVREAGKLVNVTQQGQVALGATLDLYLSRIEWDEIGIAIRLYPFTGRAELGVPKAVVIDPRIAFGKPILAHTSVPTVVVAERFKAGESLAALAEDYGRDATEIQEAIRCELDLAA
jgi:uncharacterized protein (DUF433 family)